MKIGKLFIAVVGSALTATGAIAADLPQAPTVVAPPPPMAAPAFAWGGVYIGAYGGVFVDPGIEGFQAGVQAGLNRLVGARFAVGVEAQLGWFLGEGFEANLNGRAGLVVGSRMLLYGEAGVGIVGGTPTWTAGGGLEFGIGQAISLFAEAKALLTFPANYEGTTIQAGVNFHPGN